MPALPDAEALIAEEGYDSDGFRTALAGRGIEACIPGRTNRREPVAYDTELYQSRNLSACLAESKIGAASPPATIVVPTPSSALSASLPRLSSGYEWLMKIYES